MESDVSDANYHLPSITYGDVSSLKSPINSNLAGGGEVRGSIERTNETPLAARKVEVRNVGGTVPKTKQSLPDNMSIPSASKFADDSFGQVSVSVSPDKPRMMLPPLELQ